MERYRVQPGSRVDLSKHEAASTAGFDGGKKDVEPVFESLNRRLEDLQELLWSEHRHKVLIVLQGMDTSGKDGAIRHVFDGVNPIGVRVAAFKAPTEEEIERDFLWRIHKQVPGAGEMVIFNRSHYEDVLVARVRQLVPSEVWSKRYDHINDFEKLLADTGTTILKFFLYISKEEQRERLQARVDDPQKRWKFRMGDLDDREHWDDYIAAYEEALSRTSTGNAPWYVVPSDKKWFRNLVVATVLVDALESLRMKLPEAPELGEVKVE